MDLATFRSQLAPQWNLVTLAITVVLFLFKWPLGLAMAAYVIWGQKYGLNLAQPQTFVVAGKRLGRAVSKALSDMNEAEANRPSDTGLGTGRPNPYVDRDVDSGRPSAQAATGNGTGNRGEFDQWRQSETERLRAEREALTVEKAAFAKEKAAWEAGNRNA